MADPIEIHVAWRDLGTSLQLPSGAAYKLIVDREPIPIVILPGIMGTRLRQSGGSRDKIWDPDAKVFMFRTHGTVLATARKKQSKLLGPNRVFDPGYLKVDEKDDDHNNSCFGPWAGEQPRYPNPAKRGWGGVVWDAYRPVIMGLENRMWPDPIGQCFKLPVYAVGYDWRASAKSAGKAFSARLAQIKNENPGCKKVILVTHSMGGLVARSACMAGLESDVMGVIHTVQPVTGAPAAYWRMKAGFERSGIVGHVTAWVLGADGVEVTALLGHMPGGLQLLPSMTYQDNGSNYGWLVFQPTGGGTPVRLPRTGNPYSEIYREETAPWRLVFSRDYLAGDHWVPDAERNSAWADYLQCLVEAESFHRDMGLYQHPQSWHFYGTGRRTVDSVTMTETTIDATTVVDNVNGVYYDPTPSIQERGSFSYAGPSRDEDGSTVASFYQMSDPSGDGDGTVPRSSGSALTFDGAPDIPVPNSGHDSCFRDNDLVGSTDLATNIGRIIEDLCFDKIEAEKNW